MSRALGLVETKGLVGAIEAADAMAKAADVTIIGRETVKPAMVTIKIVGETAAVKHAVEAGAYAAKAIGQLISILVIPQPDDQILNIMLELRETPEPDSAPQIKTAKKRLIKEKVVEIVETDNTPVPSLIKTQKPEIEISAEIESIKEKPAENQVIPKQKTKKVRPEKITRKSSSKEIFTSLFEEFESQPEIELTLEKTEQEPTVSRDDSESEVVYYDEEIPVESAGINEGNIPEVKEYLEELSTEEIESPDLESLNVHELRKLARSIKDFPIQGREISKANRPTLLEYLKRFQ